MLTHAHGAVHRLLPSTAFHILLIAFGISSRASALALSNSEQQRALPPTISSEAFTGEISYQFDSVLNKTTATYIAPLSSGGLLHRIFFPTPTVHTIKATYEFDGRRPSHVPDSVRVTFVSDEYTPTPNHTPSPATAPTPAAAEFFYGLQPEIAIRFGGGPAHRLVGVSQRVQLDSGFRPTTNRIGSKADNEPLMQMPLIEQAHITRTATASLSICEFLSLIERSAVDGTVGGLEFTLNQKVVAGLKLFAAEMLPDVAQERSVDCTSK
jgi:hypothetical protein